MYRQGDVLLVRVDEIPEDTKPLTTKTVALGEATGHHHTFEGGVKVLEKETEDEFPLMFVVAEADAVLTHQEHDAVAVDEGNYRVVRQREYTPESVRRVMD